MKILAIASSKGGSGKSTLARGLAVHAALEGLRVLLIDLDPQKTTEKWWGKNERKNPVVGDLGNKRDLSALAGLDFDLCLLDTPPEHEFSWRSREAIRVADLVLIPVRPSPDDIDAAGLTVSAVQAAKKPFAFIPSQITARPHLTQRQDVPKAHQSGRCPVDLKPTSDAATEMRAVWWAVSEMLKLNDKKGALKL